MQNIFEIDFKSIYFELYCSCTLSIELLKIQKNFKEDQIHKLLKPGIII